MTSRVSLRAFGPRGLWPGRGPKAQRNPNSPFVEALNESTPTTCDDIVKETIYGYARLIIQAISREKQTSVQRQLRISTHLFMFRRSISDAHVNDTERLNINETLLCTTPSNCSEVNGEVSTKTSPGELRTLLAM